MKLCTILNFSFRDAWTEWLAFSFYFIFALPVYGIDWCDFLLENPWLPATAQIVEIPAENFINVGPAALLHSDEKVYLSSLERIRREGVGPMSLGHAPTRRPLYPFSGSDIALTVLFPEAEVFINISAVGVFDHLPSKSEKFHFQRTGQGKFRYDDDLQKEAQLAPKILGALAEILPRFQVRGALAFRVPKEKRINGYFRYFDPVHTVFAFDEGPGTVLRYFIHLQLYFTREMNLDQEWWIALMRTHAPDAVLIKAAMHFFEPARNFYLGNLHALINDSLWQSQGLLVEAQDAVPAVISKDAGLGPVWEFSGRVRQQNSLIVPSLSFGYRDAGQGQALLTRFR